MTDLAQGHTSIVIREAGVGDEAAIVALVRELAAAWGDTSTVTGAYVAAYVAASGTGVLVAERAHQVVGLVSYSIRPNLYHGGPSAIIEELIVSAGYRGQGVGGRLVQRLLDQLAGLGCIEVAVSTLPGNEGAQRFYRAHGLVDEAILLEKHF
ncbi:MAG: GNAT family N-acetyltransferase [Anaerolineae bacterium]|jgi:GNAT superfamily N-acetyltransferase